MQIAHGDEWIWANVRLAVLVCRVQSALTHRDERNQVGRQSSERVARRYLAPPAESIICFRSASIG